jgi:hypothetical protein
MRTEELVKMLSTNVPPVRGQQLGGALLIALGVGTAIAFCFECAMFGTALEGLGGNRPGLQTAIIGLTLTLVTAGSRLLYLAARPGRRGLGSLLLIGAVLLVTLLAGVLGFLREPQTSWSVLLSGEPLADCAICVPVIAIPTLVALFWGLRQGAPIYPALSGAAAGLVAGALAVAALALHQPAVSVLATIVLYGGAIVACALTGAVIGRWLLQW